MQRFELDHEANPIKRSLKEIYNKRAAEAEKLEAALNDESTESELLESVKQSLHSIEEEAATIKDLLESLDEPADSLENGKRFDVVAATSEMRILETNVNEVRELEERKNEVNEELRSFKKYVSAGLRSLSETELRALNTNGAAAVLPTTVFDELITATKYSDLLHRAKVFNEAGAGKLSIPVASATAAEWHTEAAAGTEASPAISNIELGGFELMRLMTMSAATDAMTEAGFKESLLDLLSAEVVEALENAFINGTGSGQPKGLTALSWTEANTVETTAFTVKNIASALGKLPQKYARNAVILCNADTAFNALADAAADFAPMYQLGDGKELLGHVMVVSEHCPADTIFIVNPSELYVRFAMPVTVETDRSSGFRSATTDLRALCVVDAAWNPAACVKITKTAA